MASSSVPCKFSYGLTQALIQSGIGLNIVDLKPFKDFFETQCGRQFPARTTLRKNYLQKVYEDNMQQIKNAIKNECLYFVIDESRDLYNRSLVSILVGILNGRESKPMLYHTSELKEPANNKNISAIFMKSLNILFDGTPVYENVWLVVSDQATYMRVCFENLKKIGLFPNLHHITCLAHCIHRVSEKIRTQNKEVDKFISNMKLLLKPMKLQQNFKSTGLPLPPKVCLTRWSTWLNAVFFYINNFDKVKKFLKSVKNSNTYIAKIRNTININGFEQKLLYLDRYNWIPEIIKKLQNTQLRSQDCYSMIKKRGEQFNWRAVT